VTHSTAQCPNCGSAHTASRRELFLGLMQGGAGSVAFSWYSERVARAHPPKSIFVMLLVLAPIPVLVAAFFWLTGYPGGGQWLLLSALLLLAGLLVDGAATYRRYRHWRRERLCGACRTVFEPISHAPQMYCSRN